MDRDTFRKIADSLRRYQRADLNDFAVSNTDDPLDAFYTDPLPNNDVLKIILSPNTTFISGRKGTGKSTIFAKAQREIRKEDRNISVYVDVKTLYETVNHTSSAVVNQVVPENIDKVALEAHLLRKTFLGKILRELLSEMRSTINSLNFIERWFGKKKRYDDLMENLREIEAEIQNAGLKSHELPILELISVKQKIHQASARKQNKAIKGTGSIKLKDSGVEVSEELSRVDEALADEETFEEYSRILLKSYPFTEIIETITELLSDGGLKRFFVFFDDFSDLDLIAQRLFVDVILAPLNNTSNEKIKLKVACYPGRIYFGKIDPGKIDEVHLDFYNLYQTNKLPEIEGSAIDYTRRLIEKRFSYYGVNFSDYVARDEDIQDYYTLLFQTTFNIPRLMGYILLYCYMERISKGKAINKQTLRNAAKRYYNEKILAYFALNKFAIEPYNRKLDRYNQKQLLGMIVSEANSVKRRIISGEIRGSVFTGLRPPPVSHFTISSNMESLLASLELNLFLSKYHQMTDKDGKDISVFALYYGLCVHENIEWGYPQRIRYDKDYFKQRSFNYNTTLHRFLASTQTIRCDNCGASHPMENLEAMKIYKMNCPDCLQGVCKVVNLDDDWLSRISRSRPYI